MRFIVRFLRRSFTQNRAGFTCAIGFLAAMSVGGGLGFAAADESGLEIDGLDSLSTATLVRALDYLDLTRADFGFEKLYVEDDTFRIAVVEDLLNDPLKIPGWQTSVTGELRRIVKEPGNLASALGALCDAPGNYLSTDAKIPNEMDKFASSRAYLEGDAISYCIDIDGAIAEFIATTEEADDLLTRAYEKLSADEKDTLLMLAPAMWGDWEDKFDQALKGQLHFETGTPVDTTIEVGDDLILDLAVKLDRKALTESAAVFYDGLVKLIGMIDNPNPPLGKMELAGVSGPVLCQAETPWGKLVIGGPLANHYSEDALSEIAFLIETGGDDTYRGRAASAVGELRSRFGAVVDLGGDDLYEARDLSFALGGAVLGVAALFDLAGNDIYRGSDGVLGAGLFGVGLLYDGGGADIFEGRNLCQGAGAFGFGALISDCVTPPPPGGIEIEVDRAYEAGISRVPGTGFKPIRYDDNDTYLCARQSQGFASTYGTGLLYDRVGNDTYKAGGRYLHAPLLPNDFQSLSQGFSIGFRPRAGGGVGILMDEEGNDFYSAEVYAQGVGYWYSVGLLYDGGGNDSYHATQYAQGAGVHLAIGSLWDVGGDDHYVSKNGVTQGTAHDLSAGMLLDEGGNDYYLVSGGQAMSITNSAALFIDVQGNDFYATPDGGQGTVTWARGFCGTGIFLDLEGKDNYQSDYQGGDGQVWRQQSYGLGIDLDRDLKVPGEALPEIVLTAEDSLRTVEELFETASIWEVGSARLKVRTARKALIAKEIPAVDYVVAEKLGTKSGLEFRAITELARAYPDSTTKRILPLLQSEDEEVQRSVIGLLGSLKRSEGIEPMREMLKQEKHRKQWNRLIGALGRIGDVAAAPSVRLFLTDESERRRIATVSALAALKDTAAVPSLAKLLEDPVFTVRSAAFTALKRFGAAAVEPLCEQLAWNDQHSGPTSQLPRSIQIEALGRLAVALRDSTDRVSLLARNRARSRLMKELDQLLDLGDFPGARAAAVEALVELGDEETLRFVRLRMVDEFDPLVLRSYERVLEARRD